jgi:putative membrane protein
MMWWWGGDHMGAGGWIGMGFMILFWIAVVIGIVYLVRYLIARPGADRSHEGSSYWQAPGPQGPGQGRSEALKILEERYARGEIDQEEFLRRKADLSS